MEQVEKLKKLSMIFEEDSNQRKVLNLILSMLEEYEVSLISANIVSLCIILTYRRYRSMDKTIDVITEISERLRNNYLTVYNKEEM